MSRLYFREGDVVLLRDSRKGIVVSTKERVIYYSLLVNIDGRERRYSPEGTVWAWRDRDQYNFDDYMRDIVRNLSRELRATVIGEKWV